MYFKQIFTESLAHYSYILGDGKQLIVIDPQPDVNLYLDISLQLGVLINYIFETHRNEDFISGSSALAKLCGAKIYIAAEKNLDYQYGKRIKDGQTFSFNNFKLKAMYTPGHTLGSVSYVLYYKDSIHMVFVGDTLFYGDIGRFDFYGKDQLDKMAGLLYDSIYNKLLPLGDEVLMFPAHGSGSSCGEDIEKRPFSTLGYERINNVKLQYTSKAAFISANKKMLPKPPYFDFIEEINLIGGQAIDSNLTVSYKSLETLDYNRVTILDLRSQAAFNFAHIPKSIWIEKDNIVNFIPWVIEREAEIVVISDDVDRKKLLLDLKRIGYNKISFTSDFNDYYQTFKQLKKIEVVFPKEFNKVKDDYFILNLSDKAKVNLDYNDNGVVIPIEEIKNKVSTLVDIENILVVCPSGIRSNIVSSYLKKKGILSKVLIGGLDSL